MRISLVIPAYNEGGYLPRLLDSVGAAAQSYSRGPAAIQTIVADNASTDATAAIARARGCVVARVTERSIAAARNGGARAAQGEILAFVDADMRIHPGTFDAIERALDSPRVVGGATGATLERWSLGLGVTYGLMVPMAWITGMDTGVVFCRRPDFQAAGGYDERRRIAEDVAFLTALKRVGRRRRQRLTRLRGVKCIASTRKFDRHGDWHFWPLLPRLLWLWAFKPAALERHVERYWYEPER